MYLTTNKIAFDTVKMSAVSLVLQGLGLFLNIILTNTLGTVAVGVMTLIMTVFGFIIVLANGNIFISTNRFVSEEIGAQNRNFCFIMKLALTFSISLSLFFAVLSILFSGKLAALTGDPNISLSVKILALSLIPAGIGSCIRGYFHAGRKVRVPLIGEIIEFSVRWVILMAGVLFLINRGVSIYLLIAVSALFAEIISGVYYIVCYLKEYRVFKKLPDCRRRIRSFAGYMKLNLPIIAAGYVQMTMSALNDALVPVALIGYHAASDAAMSEYGLFESIIIPAIFFPSVVLTSLHTVIIPEIARANAAGNIFRVRHLTYKVFKKTLMYAVLIAGILFAAGDEIGIILSPQNPLVSDTLSKMFFVIPFIYMEIVLEGILKGLGRQGFSTVNSLIEYIIRIVCVIVFVHFYGFAGVLISYYASNIFSNIARIIAVCKWTGVRFSFTNLLVMPAASVFFSITLSMMLSGFIFGGGFSALKTVGFICLTCIVYLLLHEFDERFLADESAVTKNAIKEQPRAPQFPLPNL
ncbi:MAG: oligosaccharide flippase family protein [Ruminococcus sp.]|jgi:stage V sporulation protein B|nr:oligosaccharide flippase family protein [Ruminococcus sp.]